MEDLNFAIRQASSTDQDLWDQYVSQNTNASPYHCFAWKEAIEEAFGHKGYYLIAERNNTIQGVFPLIHLRLPFVINELTALPFCDVGNVLYDNAQALEALLAEALKLCDKLGIRKLQIRGNIDIGATSTYPISQEPHNKVRMFLDLPESSDLLMSGFKSKLRSQIRKAEKNELEFYWGNHDDLESYYDVFSINMRDLGSPVHSKLWFEKILANFGDNAKLGIVKLHNLTVGGCIILKCGEKISIPWASTLRKYNKLAPNMLLYWNVLKYAADSGFKTFDFGRSSLDEGTFKFKKQWGAAPHPLTWYTLKLSDSEKNQSNARESSRKKEIVSAMWQKLPLSLANILGPKLRKYISL